MLSEKQILKQAHERYNHAETMWSTVKRKSTELLKFISGDQWTDGARQNYEQSGFTARTQNVMPVHLRQIVNELIKNLPSIQVNPKEDATVKTAKAMDDMIRNIQEESRAPIAYATAAESAASVGIGYIIARTMYEEDSFNQKIIIEPVEDVNTIMLDPHHKGICGEDCEYVFKTTQMTKDDYNQKYSNSKLTQSFEDRSWSAGKNMWTEEKTVTVCEYYFKDYDPKTLYQYTVIENGQPSETKIGYDIDKSLIWSEKNLEGTILVHNERECDVPIIRWCKLNDIEVLEESTWPGCYIPIVAVKADEYWVDGKRKLIGAVEPAVEAQVTLNYVLSWQAQLLQMASKAPYVGTAAQFKTYEQQWENVNNSNQAFMVYNKDGDAPPPQRDLGEIPIQNAGMMITQAIQDIKQIFGAFDPNNQSISPESGKAILARQEQSYNSNYHFYENLARAIQHLGCIIISAIPIIYDTPRQVQTITESGEKRNIKINTPDENGNVEHDLSLGSYGISIQTGPSFGTKRQTAVESISEIMALSPSMAQNLAFIAIQNMDIPGAKEAAAIARAMVDPNILASAQSDGEEVPAQVVQQLKLQTQQLTQQNQALQTAGEQQHQEMLLLKHELSLVKMGKEVEMRKAELDFKMKERQLDTDEATVVAELTVKEQEIKLQWANLQLKREELGLKATSQMHEMDKDVLDIHKGRHEASIAVVIPTSGVGDTVGNDNQVGNTLDTAIGNDLGGKVNM